MDLLSLIKQLETTQWESHKIVIPDKPILTRYDLQKIIVPKGDYQSKSSGSTGVPVVVQKTALQRLWWQATNLREVLWFKRNYSLSMAVIRANFFKSITQPTWGPTFDVLGKTGYLYAHPVEGDLNAWLQKINPHYLMTYPSILETLDLTTLKNLQGIRTTGETLYRNRFSEPFHSMIVDTYSSEEVGTIAIQCPNNHCNYHVMENILLEIIDDNDKPTDGAGRVVVTDLTSSYIHRYDIGDYAELGYCDCGLGLQTIKKILGRRRNMVLLPDGTRHWPKIGDPVFRNIAPIKRYQAIQNSITEIELRLIVESPLALEQERKIIKIVQDYLLHPFNIKLVYVNYFPPGKFEEFVCKL